jgi:hypothetical protein
MIPPWRTFRCCRAAASSRAARPGSVRPRGPSAEAAAGGYHPGAGRRFAFGILHGLGALLFPALVVAALFPGIVAMNATLNYMDEYYWYLSVAPLAGLSFILILALEIVAVKWLLLGRVKEGTHRVHTLQYLRRWFFNQTMDLSLDILGPLYASIFLAPWYKMLGAKIGDGAEVSTASFISPDLLSIDEGSFVADSVSMGAPRVRNGAGDHGQEPHRQTLLHRQQRPVAARRGHRRQRPHWLPFRAARRSGGRLARGQRLARVRRPFFFRNGKRAPDFPTKPPFIRIGNCARSGRSWSSSAC